MPPISGVERELADRDAHPADALVAQAEDALAVGDHDHVDVALGPVAQYLVEPVAVRIGHEESARPAVDLAETLAGFAHGGRVDDRQRLGDVVAQHAIKQCFVAVLQRAQIDVLVEIIVTSGEFVPEMLGLLVEGLHRGRQQTRADPTCDARPP